MSGGSSRLAAGGNSPGWLWAFLVAICAAVAARAESAVIPAAPAGTVETGLPSFVVLGPEAIGLATAPTDLHLLADGRILAVAQREIALGDGVRWEVFRAVDDQAAITAQVAVDGEGRIFTGLEGKIGRVDFTEDGRWHIVPVADHPQSESNIQSSTLVGVDQVGENWFWHAGSGVIVSWKPGLQPRVVGNVSSIERIFSFGPDIYVSEQSSGGLFRLSTTRREAHRVESAAHLASETVTCNVDFGPGEVLVGTDSSGLRIFDGNNFRPFTLPGLASQNRRINDLCVVGDNRFAAAIDTYGIVFFDRKGRIVQVLDRSVDHRLARVQRLAYAPNGVLWAQLNEGVARVEYPSPISHLEKLVNGGLTFVKPVRHDGHLWLLADGRTMRGVYNSGGRLAGFEEDLPEGHYVFTLESVQGDLFAGTDLGLSVYEKTGWRLVLPGVVNGRVGMVGPSDQGLLYVARNEFGFIHRTADGFTATRHPLPGLGDNYNGLADSHGIVWLELGASRVARIDPRTPETKFEVLGPKDGLSDGWVEIYHLEGEMHFHLPNHVFRFDDAAHRFVEDTELLKRYPQFENAGGRPIADRQGRIWFTADNGAHVAELGAPKGESQVVFSEFAPTQYTLEDDGRTVWLFENRRLARLDLTLVPPPPAPLHAQVTSVQFAASGRRIFAQAFPLAPMDYADNSFVIHFAAPANPFSAPVSFEVLLEGSGDRDQWVSTGSVGSASFNRLKEGHYVFHVRPVAGGRVGSEARLELIVRPPWYRTPLAWCTYVLLAIGLVAFAAWFSSFLQRRENERLERVVTERTRELHATNAKLGQQIEETTEKSQALAASEERYRSLNAELEDRVRDRTAELSRSHGELQQRELLFRLIFEHAPVGISWKRADLGDTYHFNPTFRRILDLPADSAVDYAHLVSLVHPDDMRRQVEMNRRLASGQTNSYDLEERFVLPNGRTVWGSLSMAVIRDPAGKIIQEIGILEDITARKHAEQELADSNRNLVDVSRMAGMAEVATGVLHNVGNVLNSLNVSATIITSGLRQAKAESLVKVSALLAEHAHDLGQFLTEDPKGRRVPELIASLARHATEQRDKLLEETASLQNNVEHIKEIVSMQQTYATMVGIVEPLDPATLMEDALRMNSGALIRHEVAVIRDYQNVPQVQAEKGKVLQILVNLIRNAKYACDDYRQTDKAITLRVTAPTPGRVQLIVSDNGVGIPKENLTRIFNHGFTTRATGHGFGLHSSANAAKEMKGSLTAHSDGPGCGATFIIDLPVAEAAPHQTPADVHATPAGATVPAETLA